MVCYLDRILEEMDISIDKLSLITCIEKKRLRDILSKDGELLFSEAMTIVSALNISFDDLIGAKTTNLDEKFSELTDLGLTKNMVHLGIAINGYNEQTYKKLRYFATGRKD